MTDETIQKAAQANAQAQMEAQAQHFFEQFKNYGLLLNTMSPDELATEIGKHFISPFQCAIITTLMARLIALEGRLGAEE